MTYTETEETVERVGVAPRESEEEFGRYRSKVVTGVTLYMNHERAVDAHDRFRVRGVLYEVDGEELAASMWVSPFSGRRHGMTVQLRRIRG